MKVQKKNTGLLKLTDLHFNINQCYYSTQQKLRTLKYQECRYHFKENWYGVVNYIPIPDTEKDKFKYKSLSYLRKEQRQWRQHTLRTSADVPLEGHPAT